ncbi:chloride intracellular channel protein 4-like [Mizuhopecten yessoensis]|uniref:Chloride intracellular channel protein 4 n=1 Tax=Mizuhopecten yessoensis TaxID=6573 RepID=A0A210QQD4_MIZYE|nr:chloride intracellular channel protein 4-like [Mizuhopecten yessoensis]OWF50957.1 Chloride intracellular channel protein 4 [Mizuhopecten yessoensis]
MSEDAPFFEPIEGQDDRKPSFELYIKASTIDYASKGSCPICQQWFMLAYLLAEKQSVSFRVYTVLSSSPPKTFSEKLQGKNPSQYPVVIGLGGEDSNGQTLINRIADEIDEVEQFFEEVNPYFRDFKRNTPDNLNALHHFQDLSKKFNAYLQGNDTDGVKLTNYLKVLDQHLCKLETKFLCGNSLSYADCCLLPKLQHVRVAGDAFNNYMIPSEFSGIWKYLQNAYSVPAFVQTLPADRDIISHYIQKAVKKLVGAKSPHLLKLEPPTISVPMEYLQEEVVNTEEEEVINNGEEEEEEAKPNGENGDDQDQMPEPDEINTEVYQQQQELENDEGQENFTNGDNPDENSGTNE